MRVSKHTEKKFSNNKHYSLHVFKQNFLKTSQFRMHKKALSLDVNMKERFQACLRTIFQAYMQTNILTYRQPRKRYLKKKVKLFSNIQTCKHSNTFCVRERETEAQ